MKEFDREDVGENATAGETEERSGHTDRVTYGYDATYTTLLCSDIISVPGEFSKAQRLDEPLDSSAKRDSWWISSSDEPDLVLT